MSDLGSGYPQRISFSVNTFTDPEGSLILESQTGVIQGNIGYWPVDHKPSSGEWEEFHAKLQKLNIWRWKKAYEYEDMVFIDGTKWNLSIEWNSNYIQSVGSNRYPKNFKKLVKAVKTLCQIEELCPYQQQ
jgi:hypothetical protein